jgi:hypothetical protein
MRGEEGERRRGMCRTRGVEEAEGVEEEDGCTGQGIEGGGDEMGRWSIEGGWIGG